MDEMRPVPGFEGLYSVTRDGRVWSHPKRMARAFHNGQWLRPGASTSGYLTVVLRRDCRPKSVMVHRLVAMAWLPKVDGADEVNHLDGHKHNNIATNLEWCTRSENQLHAWRIGLNKARRGGILTMDQAATVRALVIEGERQIDVARRLGVAKQVINCIVLNRTYRAP